jgi:hypothetical protein
MVILENLLLFCDIITQSESRPRARLTLFETFHVIAVHGEFGFEPRPPRSSFFCVFGRLWNQSEPEARSYTEVKVRRHVTRKTPTGI